MTPTPVCEDDHEKCDDDKHCQDCGAQCSDCGECAHCGCECMMGDEMKLMKEIGQIICPNCEERIGIMPVRLVGDTE